MTYFESEASKHGGKPVELFRYQGTYANFYYTSGPIPVEYQAVDEDAPNTYIPITMRRSAINSSTQNDDNSEVTIEMPVSTDIIVIYGFSISPPDLVLTIFRGHNPGQFIRSWSGDVENISVVKGTATIRVPSALAAALSADFPNVYFQTPCNHDLFDARCGVPYEDWSFETAVAAIATRDITVDGIDDLDGNLVGGEALLASGERRMIIGQVGNVITVNYPFAGAEVDSVITLAAGCDLAYQGDCKTRFNNTKRYGGFPYIPPKNIFATGLEPGKDVADEACLPPAFDGWYIRIRISWINLLAPEPSLGCFLYRGEGSAVTRSSQVDYEYIEWEQDWEGSYDVQGCFLQSQYGGSQNSTTKAIVTYRRWDQTNYQVALPVPPSDYMDEGGGYWDVHGVGPVNQYFNF